MKHKPTSKQMQGTSPSKVQAKPNQKSDIYFYNLLFLRQRFKTNVITLPASANCLQFMTLPTKNDTDDSITIINCKTTIFNAKIQLNYT
jgi:hypothetical protein